MNAPTGATPTFRLSAFYLLYFAALGALVPYWTPYLKSLGFSPREIGELMAVFMATRIVAPMATGWLSDRLGQRMLLVRATTVGACAAFAGVFFGTSYAWLAAISAIFSFCRSASLAPFEAVTLNHLGRHAERYGRIRLWGSLGFIVGVVALGAVLEAHGESMLLPIVLAGFGGIALLSFAIPDHPGPPVEGETKPFWEVLRRPTVVALMVVSMLIAASHGPYYTFFTIHLEARGYAKGLIGWLWALGVLAEIGLFLLTTRLLRRFSARGLMLVCLALTALRWVLIARYVQHLPVLLLAQTMHAASFGLFHAVNIHVIHSRFVGPHQARGQALYASLSHGVGGAAGALSSGYLHAAVGADYTFLAAAALPAAGILIAAIWMRSGPPDAARA